MTKNKKNRERTYARNRTAVSRRGYEKVMEADSTYFLKLVMFFLLGTFWLKFADPFEIGGFVLNALPVGLLLGLILVKPVEKYQFNRKIWYAVLLLVGIVTYFDPSGIVI